MKHKWTDNRGMAFFGVWEKVVWLIVLIWVVSFTLVSIPSLVSEFPKTAWVIRLFDNTLPLLFLVEYAARIICSSRRIRYLLSGMGVVDLVVCLPALLPLLGVDEVSVLYSLRIVELFCVFKILRFNKALAPIGHAFNMVRNELIVFFTVFAFLNYFFAMGIYMAEREAQPEKFASILDGLWFAVVSLTTTGYGDLVPVTYLGKLFSGCLLALGVALVAVPTALLTSATTRLWQSRRLENIEKALHKKEDKKEDKKEYSGPLSTFEGGNVSSTGKDGSELG